ncbi:MAG: hypothetical protein HRT94_02570 [Alphaproteobacteria bacterium]|nr:hypothetical protein [Alphaproteobacteria bacterium]
MQGTLALGISGMAALYVTNPTAFETLGANILDGFNSVSYGQEDVEVEELDDLILAALEEAHEAPVDIIKDPIAGAVVPQSSSSVGENDDRDPAYVHQTIFNPVAELASGCTTTFVQIDGHQIINNDHIFVTAAHCIDDSGAPFIVGNYSVEVNGRIEERSYEAVATEVWMHPFYEHFRDEIGASERTYTPYDVAILRVDRDAIPADVEPANLQAVDFSTVMDTLLPGMTVSSLGYSADRQGLTYHQNCSLTDRSFRDFGTNCDIAGGASGGNLALPFDPDGDERLTILAINGGTYRGTENARHSFFEANMITMVPFLVPIEGGEPEQCAQVTTETSNLNRRFEPNLDGMPLSSQEREHFGALPRHSLVQVFGSINGWNLVQPIDGNGIRAIDDKLGYSSGEFLTSYPCPMR